MLCLRTGPEMNAAIGRSNPVGYQQSSMTLIGKTLIRRLPITWIGSRKWEYDLNPDGPIFKKDFCGKSDIGIFWVSG